ncbi:4763_t:CDS:2 [Cetraspora pellucida]|uniref:4763_t:CDS:1 n=1 Tax=Cetraspora pellucida TaxID=1433469 RepID=A0A9N8ZMU9_9GLOM|nr:4763_t:CDS:2 [Cetraspora pellucida]
MNLSSNDKQLKISILYKNNILQDMCFFKNYKNSDLYNKLKELKQVLNKKGL